MNIFERMIEVAIYITIGLVCIQGFAALNRLPMNLLPFIGNT